MTSVGADSQTRRGRSSKLGVLLRSWRRTRGLSQLALATRLSVSSRHLSFVETGRAAPSRDMVLHLAEGLEVPLRERNALLLAAGFAPVYQEANLDAPDLAPVHRALTAILRQQEPYPAIVMDRRWNLVRANEAARTFFGWLLADRPAPDPPNILRVMFDPALLRPFVVDWERVAEALIQRVHREAVGGVPDETLIDTLLAYPGVPARWSSPRAESPAVPIIPVSFARDDRRFNYFSTVTTLGTPQDITLQELRVECFFPLDDATEKEARRLSASRST